MKLRERATIWSTALIACAALAGKGQQRPLRVGRCLRQPQWALAGGVLTGYEDELTPPKEFDTRVQEP